LPHLVLTGGDPLKRVDMFDLIDAAVTLGFGVSVSPSATPLLTPDAVRALKGAGVEAISLSLDGSTPERHDGIRGIAGTFDRTLAAARAAAQAGLMYQVNTLVSAETLDDLPAIYELARELGAARWSLFFLVSVGRGTVLQQISGEQCDRVMRWAAELAGRGKPVVTTTEAPHFRRIVRQIRPAYGAGHAAGVRDGNGVMFISHTGDVTPAGFLPVVAGNVREADPVTLYRESPLFRELRQADRFGGRCGRCEFHWMCGGSRARAYAATGDVLAEDPLCDYEPRVRAAAVVG
jgi:radical SAM protein with 4Fe4S-binding SPASM domain